MATKASKKLGDSLVLALNNLEASRWPESRREDLDLIAKRVEKINRDIVALANEVYQARTEKKGGY